MKISRVSPLTQIETTLDLSVTAEQIDEFNAWPRRLIQDIFPQLSNAEREFILTGYTAEDWDALFKDEEQ